MGLYKEGLNRKQQLMFPPSLDELVAEDNMVRAIEEYVNILTDVTIKRNLTCYKIKHIAILQLFDKQF
jgi:hypothetical protein